MSTEGHNEPCYYCGLPVPAPDKPCFWCGGINQDHSPLCHLRPAEPLIPAWRQRARERIAETGRNVAVVDTTGIVLDVDARAFAIAAARRRALDDLPSVDDALAFARSLR